MSGDSNPRCAQFPIIASRCGVTRNIKAVSRTAAPRSGAPKVSAVWVLRKRNNQERDHDCRPQFGETGAPTASRARTGDGGSHCASVPPYHPCKQKVDRNSQTCSQQIPQARPNVPEPQRRDRPWCR